MSGFCVAVDSAACASRLSNLSMSGFILILLPTLAVFCGCSVLPIDIRYQVFDTAHTRSISGYLLRLPPALMLEYFMVR